MSIAIRGSAVRGITTPSPEGWSVPDPAEKLAALARQSGWTVTAQSWYHDRQKGLWTFFLGVERLLRDGEGGKSPGVGWRYHLVWEEIPADDLGSKHRTKMAIRVSRAYTPHTGKWGNGPTIKTISDTIARNPARSRRAERLKANGAT